MHVALPKTPSFENTELLREAVIPPPGLTAVPIGQSNGINQIHSITPLPEMCAESSYVLITDDNPINRRLLVAFMNKRKLRYQEAENGLEALNAYQEGRVRFDVILMDISMPVMDGMTATRLIRDHESRHKIKPTHIIALTGLVSASARLEAWSSGVDCYMTKPVDFRKLEKMLHVNKEGAGKNEG
jgi:CheY-like chemotaxis protein